MQTIASAAFYIGIIMVFTANLAMRSSGAPAIGTGPRRLPWQGRENFKGIGFWLQAAGWAIWIVAAVAKSADWWL